MHFWSSSTWISIAFRSQFLSSCLAFGISRQQLPDSDTGHVADDEWSTCGTRRRSSEAFLPPWLQFHCMALNHPDLVANGSVAGRPCLHCIALRSQTTCRNNKSLTALSWLQGFAKLTLWLSASYSHGQPSSSNRLLENSSHGFCLLRRNNYT
jgi:hypothetical protein